jgi:hypothetical protein
MSENTDNDMVEKVTTLEKPKRKQTEKQIEQFKNVILKKKELYEKRQLEKKIEASKLLLQHDPEFIKQTVKTKEKPKKKELMEKEYESSTEEEDEEEESSESEKPIKKRPVKPVKEVYKPVKEKSKPRKAKLIIYSESESESDNDSTISDHIPKPIPKSQHHAKEFKSQQNKKSLINIKKDTDTPNKIIYDPKNYFV